MSATEEPRLDAGLRERLAEIADAVFPPTGPMPAASTVGLSTGLVDRVLRAEPRLLGPFVRTIAALPAGDASAALCALRDGDETSFRALVLVIISAYYMAPEVRAAIGYEGQQAVRTDVFDLPEYLENGTLDRVIARRAFYRDPQHEEVPQ